MLELAYWIGRNPGHATAPGYRGPYRDSYTPDEGHMDRGVVMHLHINEQPDWLRIINGRTHIGVPPVLPRLPDLNETGRVVARQRVRDQG